jgi:hypothetical protein
MDYMKLLEQYDDPKHWEYPPRFDHNSATERFTRCVQANHRWRDRMQNW